MTNGFPGKLNYPTVTTAFTAGVQAKNVPQSDAKPRARKGDQAFAEVESLVAEARAMVLTIADTGDPAANPIVSKAVDAIDAIDAVVDEVIGVREAIQSARDEATARFRGLPIDEATRANLETASSQHALEAVLRDGEDKMFATAKSAGVACAELERELGYQSAFTDSDLVSALDGEITTSEAASGEFLFQQLAKLSMRELRKMYALLQRSAEDLDRVIRFERAAIRIADSVRGKTDAELAPRPGAEGREQASSQRELANALLSDIKAARAARAPKSLAVAGDLLEKLRVIFRLAVGFDPRPGSGAVSDVEYASATSSPAALAEARRSWVPMAKFHVRYMPTGTK